MSEQITQAAPPTLQAHDAPPGPLKRMLGGSVGRNLGLVIALGLLVAVGTLTAGDRFASFDNFVTITRFASIIGVISIGMTFVITAGGIDLSVGSVMGLSTVVASLAAVQLAATQTSWLLMVVIALAVGTLAGLVNGVVIAYGNVVAFMATLAMLVGARGLAELVSNRSTQIVNNQGFLDFFRADLLGVPILIWIFLVGNREASRLAGIKVKRHMVYIYMISGLTSGIAAVMMLGRTTAGTSTHGLLYELDAIAMVVVGGTLLIGGRGTIVGTVLGVLIFSTLTNVFTQNNLSVSVQNVAKGVIIVVAVLLQQRFASRGSRGK